MEGRLTGVVEENRGTMDITRDMVAQFHDKFSRHVAKITAEDETEVLSPRIPPPNLPLPPSKLPTSTLTLRRCGFRDC
jgi:hypothetical protein